MNGLLLLAGLSPLIIFSIVYMIKSKKYLFPAISLTVSCAAAVTGFFLPSGNNAHSTLSEDWLNYLAGINMASGSLDKAEDYIDDMYGSYGDTPDVLTSLLRLSVLRGDMDNASLVAKTLAAYMEQNEIKLPDAEQAFVDDVISGSYVTAGALSADKAVYDSLEAAGVNPADYGYEDITDTDITTAKEADTKLQKKILSSVKNDISEYSDENSDGSLLQSAVNNAAKLRSAYSSYMDNGESSLKEVKKYTTLLNAAYKNDSGIFSLPEVRDAYILGLVATQNYEALLSYALSSDDAAALATVASLYISGAVTSKDFSGDFADTDDYSDIVEKCRDILSDIDTDDYSNSEISMLEDYIKAISAKNSHPILSELEKRLEPEYADDTDKAAMYIQDSSINSALSDKEAAFSSLNNALNALNSTDNETLKEALDEISSIVDNSSASDNITSLNDYLSQAYKSSLPLDGSMVTVPEEYLNTSNSYVNEKRAMINIGVVNTESFPEIKAYVSTSGTDLTDTGNIVVTDCGAVIEDYTIEKVQYDASKIFLVCDNSGSMSGNIDSLKTAVRKFAASKNSREQIGIITFDSSVLQNTGLTTDNSELQDAIDKFHDGGGTNIGCGVDAAFDGLSSSGNSFNVIIVMTDGQDSSYSSEDALRELRRQCTDKNVILYTIGLGDVSADYLKDVADSGMGSFIYSSDGVQLEELYSFIHNQLDNNYVLTYTAKDKNAIKDRLLTISNKADGYTGKRYYSLNYDDDDENTSEDGLNDNPDGISVSRLGISTVIKGSDDTAEFTVLGSGFDRAESISVALSGSKQYQNLSCSVSNDKKLTVQLPANTAYDTYDVTVTINGTPYTLSGLSVLKPGSSSTVVFGDYIFSAMSVIQDGNTTTLKGNVIMNGYLHFNGDVTLDGSLDGNVISLSESSGSYIAYNAALPGLLGLFYDNTLSVPAISSVSLYSDGDKYSKYYVYGKSYYGPLEIYDPYIELHPDFVQMTLCNLSFDFPLLNNVLEYAESPIKATGEEKSVILSKDTPGIVYKLSSDTNLGKSLHLGPAELSLSGVELAIDTIKNDYSAGLTVGMDGVPVFADTDGVDFSFKIGIAGGKFDSLDLGADIDVSLVKVPPVALADFHAGVEGLSGSEQNASFGKKLLGAVWYGQCDVNFFKLNEIIPGLDTLLGDFLDIAILSLDDTKLSLRLSNFNLSLDTTAKLLEAVELGKAEIDIGSYSYKNYLLGIDSDVNGLHLKTSTALGLDFGNNFKFNVGGSSQVDINNKFAGVMSNGTIDYSVKVFKKFTGDMEGNFLMGIHNNASQFTVLVKTDDYAKGKDSGFRITFTKGDWFPDVKLY